MVDIDKLTPVTKNYTKARQVGDIRFSPTQEKFFVSDDAFSRHGLSKNGFMLHYNHETGDLFVSLHPNDEAIMYTGEGQQFQSSEFIKYLYLFDWVQEEQEDDLEMDMNFVKETDDGVKYYQLSVLENNPAKSEEDEDGDEEEKEPVSAGQEEPTEQDSSEEDGVF